MQRVDPFIPVSRRANLPPKRPLGQVPKRPAIVGSSIDGVRRQPTLTSHAITTTPGQETVPVEAPAPVKRKRRWLQKLQLPLSALGILVLGFLLQSVVIGQALIAIFAVYALIRRIESRTIFMLALLLIAGIILLLLVGTNIALITNFAVYAFLLFAIGAVSLGREVLYE